LRKLYFITADKWGWTISETDKEEFYMIEYLLGDLEEKIDEENKRYKKQEDDYKKQTQISQPKMPKVGDTNFGGFKTPKLNMPKISMPKF
jgi:hypothetical protein